MKVKSEIYFSFSYYENSEVSEEEDFGVTISFSIPEGIFPWIKEDGDLRDSLNNFADSFELLHNCRIIEWANNNVPALMEWELMFLPGDNRSLEERRVVLDRLMGECRNVIERAGKLKAMM